jgi:hypothetical protein
LFEGPFVFAQLRRQTGKGLSRGKFAAPEPRQRPARRPALQNGDVRGIYRRPDVHLLAENECHRFVQETLRDAGVVPI